MGNESGKNRKSRIFSEITKKLGHHNGHSNHSVNAESSLENTSTISLGSTEPQSDHSTPSSAQRRSGRIEAPGISRQGTASSAHSQILSEIKPLSITPKNPNGFASDKHIGSPENPIPTQPVRSRTPNDDSKRNSQLFDGSDSDDDFLDDGGTAMKIASNNDGSMEFSVMLNEACEDTPSFRASAEYSHIMFTDLEQWLENLSAKNSHVVAQLSNVKNSVNDVIGSFMPNVTHCSILAQDYTTLLFGRYTEAEQIFWTDLFVHAARNANDVVTMVRRLRATTFVKYHHARQEYVTALQRHDACLADLFRLPNNAEPGAQRDAIHHLHVARRRFLKSSTKLVLVISEVESETSVSLLETLSRHFMSPDNGFLAYDQQRIAISIEFHRLQSAAAALRKSLPHLALELKTLRHNVLLKNKNKTAATEPDEDLSTAPKAPVRFGWVNVETAPGKWEILWAYMQHGLFGFLGLSKNKTAVIESNRFIAASSQFDVIKDNDKRCLFRVRNAEGIYVNVQATGKHDSEHWQQAFMTASASLDSSSVISPKVSPQRSPGMRRSNTLMSFHSHVSSQTSSRHGSSHGNPSNGESNANRSQQPRSSSISSMWSPKDSQPWNRSFAIPGLSDQESPDSEAVVAKIEDLRHDIQSLKWLKYDSTSTSQGAMDFDMKVPSIKPLPTSVQFEAVVANSFFRPEFTCNAITANLWGSTGLHLTDMTNDSVARQHHSFPEYPDNYARSLVVQDMDMRCIVAQLPSDEQMMPDEIMSFVLRTVAIVNHKDVPARLYVTNYRILVYSAWRGIVSVKSAPVENVLDIETSHGIDFSTLRITLQKDELKSRKVDEQGGEAAVLDTTQSDFKLFIDSSVLAKRKLDYVKENGRSASPLSSRDVLGQLAVISMEHAENLKRHEAKTLHDLRWRPRPQSSKGGPTAENKNEIDVPKSENNRFATWLLESVVGEGSHRGEEDAMDLGKGMKMKLGEDTFPIKADALFLAVFGSRSPVFSGVQRGILESDCEVGSWYRKGKRIERRIQERFSSFGKKGEKRYNIQRIEQQRTDLYVVSERRSPWEMPTGDQFYTVMKYVIYSTNRGCHLQIWSRTVWTSETSGAKPEHTIEQGMRMVAQAILSNIRNAANRVQNVDEARKSYGSVKATKVVNSPTTTTRKEDEHVTRVSTRNLLMLFIKAPMTMSVNCQKIWHFITWWLACVSNPVSFLIVVLMSSLMANVVLYNRYSHQYWNTVLDRQETNSIIDALKLSPTQQSSFKRAIYTKDLDDLSASGSLWRVPADETNLSLSSHQGSSSPSMGSNHSGCAAKFAEIAALSLWAPEYGTLYQFEPRVQSILKTISDTRLEFAVKRNDMLTMLSVLNQKELEALQHVYRNWLIDEATMCSHVRGTSPLSNETVSSEISAYCISCSKEARNLF